MFTVSTQAGQLLWAVAASRGYYVRVKHRRLRTPDFWRHGPGDRSPSVARLTLP